jgi:predicted RNA binding protein YcfA (HicA-like mRNA interferase family)
LKVPRDVSGANLAKALRRYGYAVRHQTGSHMRLTTTQNGEHHITIPNSSPLPIGLLNALFRDIARHHRIDKSILIQELFP